MAIFRSKTFWLVLLVILLTLVYTNSRQAYKANAPVYQSTQGSSAKPATKSDDAPADKSAASDDNTDARKKERPGAEGGSPGAKKDRVP
jgi:hypothetical protein